MVFLGRDTRPSSGPLLALLEEGARSVGCESKDFELTTTP